MAAKHQHYVPRAYLAAFTDPETPAGQEPYIWVYERQEENPYARAPHKLAVRTHYYSFTGETGETDTAVEDFLSRIESQATPLLRRLANGGEPNDLDDEERGKLAYFIALLSVRIPGFRDAAEKFAADVMRKVSLLGAQHTEYFERTMRDAYAAKGKDPPKDIEAVRQFVLSGEYDVVTDRVFSLQILIQVAPRVAEYVYRYNWRLLRAASGRFVTSDRPVVLVSTTKLPPPYNWGTGWETPWMEAALPLSPETCLLISLHHPSGVEEVDDAIVREVNRRMAAYATEAVYSSSKIQPAELNRPKDWDWWQPVTDALYVPQRRDGGGNVT